MSFGVIIGQVFGNVLVVILAAIICRSILRYIRTITKHVEDVTDILTTTVEISIRVLERLEGVREEASNKADFYNASQLTLIDLEEERKLKEG